MHEEATEGVPQVVDNAMLAALNKSEIDQQIATAHKFPRSIKRFRDECLDMVTLTEEIAQECIYALPRDGKVIEGPSARFAEIVASAWGNCRAGARVVAEEQEFVVCQGAFHDLQRNVAIQHEVRRRIVDRYGKRYKPDMIGVTANAGCSIALRNAILKGIPKAFWVEMYEAARRTVMGDSKTLANRRADAIAYLQGFGANEQMICAVLGVEGVEGVGQEELVTLRGIATAIKDGDTTVEQAFAIEPKGGKPEVKAPQRKSEQKAKGKGKAEGNGKAKDGPATTGDKPRFAVGDDAEIIDTETGEVVPEKFVTRRNDGTFSVAPEYGQPAS